MNIHVFRGGDRVVARGLSIRGGENDEPVHLFRRPARADEFAREPVEQFGMRRLHAVSPEVARRLDEASAEVTLPDAVHHHAGGERILRAGDPIGERCAALLLGGVAREFGGAECAEDRWDDLIFRLLGITAIEKVDGIRRAELSGESELAGFGGFDFRDDGFLFRHQPRGLGGFLGAESGRGESGTGICAGDEWPAIGGVGDELPLSVGGGDFDPVVRGQPVLIFPLAVAAPRDACDFLLLRKLQRDPAFAGLARHPAPRIPVASVVDKTEFMTVRDGRIAGRGRHHAATRERDVFARGVERFEFVETRLQAVRGEDREAQPLRWHR